jgi:hypothetical protein
VSFTPIQTALKAHFSSWQETAGTRPQKLSASAAGLDPSLNLAEVDYGQCSGGGFYVYALKGLQTLVGNDTYYSYGYYYTTNPQNMATLVYCKPDDWLVTQQADLGGGWGYALVAVLPPKTPTPAPTGR